MVIFLDNNATTPLAPEVVNVIKDALETAWVNPSSGYERGRKTKALIEDARLKIATMIEAAHPSEEITFTSGGTEANYTVMHWAIEEFKRNPMITSGEKPHIITTNIEHCATELPLQRWAEMNLIDVSFVPVDKNTGMVRPADIIKEITSMTCLVTVMLANNETGVIQPIKSIFEKIREINRKPERPVAILTHTDAAQAFGKIPVSVQDLDVDYMTIVGHKFYGPRIGAIYHRKNTNNDDRIIPCGPPIFLGGGQEYNRRSGTENTPMIIGLGQAAHLVTENSKTAMEDLEMKRNKLISELKKSCCDGDENIQVNFESSPKLPNTASICFKGVPAGAILEKCGHLIEFSKSAACHSGSGTSNVLIKSGLEPEAAASTVRLSVGRYTSLKETEEAANILSKAFNEIKN